MRRRRRTVASADRRLAAERLAAALIGSPLFRRSRHIAAYLANDGELDLASTLVRARAMRKQLYLPALHGQRLWFFPYREDTPLAPNRFAIPEPALHPTLRRAPNVLDLVLMPLVAFDLRGHRIGMGGGYYDRTFAYLLGRLEWRRPKLIGIAYDFQQTDAIEARHWDVPLDGIATENGLRLFQRARTTGDPEE
jgi:5-formyltetrahydrofolate cyclo-ligase